MKRLCVFYYRADEWVGKKIEWIVCKECAKRITAGKIPVPAEEKVYNDCKCQANN